ncbi:N-acyl-D-amino-acid deacylase family protein [Microlunatus soli]|uniref:Dihydroorotase n=1 Tax=Microlunatus soli TaxID=630515 RepID=A0A1H1R0M8_9ACTN|nr:amidohydrolase family protein [Microlunatus soli]SDS29341.1 dihydroorotase [Microlunatus soli]
MAGRATLLRGGLVIDGTGADPQRRDLVLADGAVADGVIVDRVADATIIDVTGRLVLPGFVDIHTHSDLTLLSAPDAPSRVRQGITTEVIGNCGLGTFPVGRAVASAIGPDRAGIRAAVSYLDLDPAIAWDWEDLGGYREELIRRRPAVNVAALVGHLPLHAGVCGFDNLPPTDHQLRRMQELLAGELAAGAVGLSTGLVYPPLTTVGEQELTMLAEVVRDHDALFAWHVRDYADDLVSSVQLALRVARRTGCRTQISHLNAVGRRNWPAIGPVLAEIDAARVDGVEVGIDLYPYLYGNAPLAQLLPDWAQQGPVERWRPLLAERDVRRRIADHWRDPAVGWDEITISRIAAADDCTLIGHSVAASAADLRTDPVTLALDLLTDHGTGVLMVAGGRSTEVMNRVLGHPGCVIASDGLSLDPHGPTGTGSPHPRSYGCFARYLADVISTDPPPSDLSDAVARCTSRPAARVGLNRGRLLTGAAADVVVIDPARLADRASFSEPQQFPAGIEHVLVGGVPVVRDGQPTGARPGVMLSATTYP